MKAIIIAAGLGSRMKKLTEKRPKCSLPINGIPLFEHQLSAFKAMGIDDISVVIGHRPEFFDDYPEIKKYVNEDFRNNNILLSLMTAASELDSDVIVSYSDIIFRQETLRNLTPLQSDFTAVVDLDWRQNYIGRSDHPESQAENVVISKNQISSIGKHVDPQKSDGEFIGVFALSQQGCLIWKETFAELESHFSGRPFKQALRFEEAYLTDMIQEIIDRGFRVEPHLIRGGWMELDTEQDYRAAGLKFSG